MARRSGTARAANGEAVLPIVVVGRIDVAGAVEVEVVGVGAAVRSRRPVVAVVAGGLEQLIGILNDEAAPNLIKINIQGSARSCWDFFVAVATKSDEQV